MPDEKPADIYKVVAEKTVAKMEMAIDVQKGTMRENEQDEDEVTDAQLAAWWLEFGIDRKVTKRNTMTFAYGSKQRGMSDKLLKVEEKRHCSEIPQGWPKTELFRKWPSAGKRNCSEKPHLMPPQVIPHTLGEGLEVIFNLSLSSYSASVGSSLHTSCQR